MPDVPMHAGFGGLMFEVQDQPGDCSIHCPCHVGDPGDSEYGMRWTPQEEVARG